MNTSRAIDAGHSEVASSYVSAGSLTTCILSMVVMMRTASQRVEGDDAMVTLFIDRRQSLLLVQLSGDVTGADFNTIDRTLEGLSKPAPTKVVVDMTMVDQFDMAMDAFASRGRRGPLLLGGESVFVAPRSDIFGMARLLATHRSLAGHGEPRIERTFEAALETLAVADPDFQPLERSTGV